MVRMFRVTETNQEIMQLRLPCKQSGVMACVVVKSWEKARQSSSYRHSKSNDAITI